MTFTSWSIQEPKCFLQIVQTSRICFKKMSLENKEVPDVKSGVSSPVLDEDKTLAANFHQASDNSNLVCTVFFFNKLA